MKVMGRVIGIRQLFRHNARYHLEAFLHFLSLEKLGLCTRRVRVLILVGGWGGVAASLSLKMWLNESLPLLRRFTWKVLILSLALVQLVYRVNSQMDLRK